MITNNIRVGGHKKLDPEQIVFLQGDTNYTQIHLQDGSKLVVATTLKILESRLECHGFFRMHKSSLVNLIYVRTYDAHASTVRLSNNRVITLSRRKNKAYQLISQNQLA